MKKKKIKPGHWTIENDDDECERINFDGRSKGVAAFLVNHGIDIPFSHLFFSTSHVYPWGQQWLKSPLITTFISIFFIINDHLLQQTASAKISKK